MNRDLPPAGDADSTPSELISSANLDPSQFPILMGTASKTAGDDRWFREALYALSTCLRAGAMRKVVHEELKDVFARAVDKAWDRTVGAVYFHEGRYESLPKDVQDLNWSISLMSLHDVLSTKKKLDRAKCVGPAVDAMRALIDEAHVLAVAMAGLRSKLIKGRPAQTEEQRARAEALANPDKIVMTCSCCFRPIALAGETMAHHGYERPGYGSQTASCMGIKFRPLEVSSEGLECILKFESELLARLEHVYNERETVSTISRLKDRELVEFHRGDKGWERELLYHVAELESQLRMTRDSVADLQGRLAAWVQTQPLGLSSIRKLKQAKREATTA